MDWAREGAPGVLGVKRRVRGQRYRYPLPSERYVRVSTHTAQAFPTHRAARGFTTVNPWLWTW